MVSRIPNGCKKGDAILEDEHTGSTGEKQEKNRSIGSAISICFQFYNEVVASIEGIKCKYNRHSTSARFGVEMDSWPLFRGDQVSISLFSVAKCLTRPLSTHGLRILFDPIYNCGADPLSCQGFLPP